MFASWDTDERCEADDAIRVFLWSNLSGHVQCIRAKKSWYGRTLIKYITLNRRGRVLDLDLYPRLIHNKTFVDKIRRLSEQGIDDETGLLVEWDTRKEDDDL